jgi:pimeloyl-ACP methyl ester carboxylesterase
MPLWLPTLALAVLLAAPFIAERLRKPMNAAARTTAPGAFARLSQGVTHYRWTGPGDGPVVVCIHGLTTPSFVWQGVARVLADSGYRVLTYDLYGRGYSDRPPGRQTPAFFLRQLEELLADQGITGPVAVIGYSMGGAIATAFVAARPDAVRTLVLFAPAGMLTVGSGLLRRLIAVPFLGRWLMLARYPSLLRRGLRAEAHHPGSVPGINRLQRAELEYRGFLPAVHESFLGMLTGPLSREHERIAEAGTPVLAIWGETDDVIPLSAKDLLAGWNPQVRHHVIPGAGHGLTYTHTPQVMAQVLPFLDPAA